MLSAQIHSLLAGSGSVVYVCSVPENLMLKELVLLRCVCFAERELHTGMGGCSALNSYCKMYWKVQEKCGKTVMEL